MLPSCIELGIGSVGLAIGLHQSPLWLPAVKPFNCLLCLSLWFGLGLGYTTHGMIAGLTTAGIGSVGAIMVLYLAPWAARDFPRNR